MEELIFYTDKIMVMGNSKNLHELNSAIYRENGENLMLTNYTCFTVLCGLYYLFTADKPLLRDANVKDDEKVFYFFLCSLLRF